MKKLLLTATLLTAAALLGAAPAPLPVPAFWDAAPTPPMGWNSWDCFGTQVTEAQTLENADYMEKNLKSHGWSIVTVDIQWYEPNARGLNYRRNAVLEMDANGRLLPAPNRFPSSKDSRSFKPLADALHAKGLKFGLHLLRGIPRQAVTQNTPILNTPFHAADIANTKDICPWNPDMYGVDMTKPGAQEYYDSVFAQFAAWEIDLIKVDDLSARIYHTAEIEAIRKAIDKTGRKIIFSTSPGATPVAEGAHVQSHANMWRISDDFWDSWKALKEQFARLDAWTPYRGPGHFPDADMLPVGNVRAFQTRDNWTHFTHDELTTMISLWSIARSPLILGGNLPKNDDFTLALLTNDEVLAVNQHSTHNKQLFRKGDLVAWVADVPNSPDKYLALFNATELPPGATTTPSTTRPAPLPTAIVVTAKDLGVTTIAAARDLWAHKPLDLKDNQLSVDLLPHTSALLRVTVK